MLNLTSFSTSMVPSTEELSAVEHEEETVVVLHLGISSTAPSYEPSQRMLIVAGSNSDLASENPVYETVEQFAVQVHSLVVRRKITALTAPVCDPATENPVFIPAVQERPPAKKPYEAIGPRMTVLARLSRIFMPFFVSSSIWAKAYPESPNCQLSSRCVAAKSILTTSPVR